MKPFFWPHLTPPATCPQFSFLFKTSQKFAHIVSDCHSLKPFQGQEACPFFHQVLYSFKFNGQCSMLMFSALTFITLPPLLPNSFLDSAFRIPRSLGLLATSWTHILSCFVDSSSSPPISLLPGGP